MYTKGLQKGLFLLVIGCALSGCTVPSAPVSSVQNTETTPAVAAKTAAPSNENFFALTEAGKVTLYQKNKNGAPLKTGLVVSLPLVSTTSEEFSTNIVVSPNSQLAAYNFWNENSQKWEIFVSDISGKNIRKLAEPEGYDGHAALNIASLAWTMDNSALHYSEPTVLCPDTKTTCLDPNDLQYGNMNYQIDLATGQKILLSKTFITP